MLVVGPAAHLIGLPMHLHVRCPIIDPCGDRRALTTGPLFLVALLAPLMLSACLGVRSDVIPPGTSTPESQVVRDLSAATRTATTRPAKPTAHRSTPAGSVASDNGRTYNSPAVTASVEHLADDLGISPGDVTVTSVEAKDWSDSGLGCPQPDMFYLQVITPGYQIVLEVGGQQAVYHTDRADPPNVIRCGPDVGVVSP